MMPVLSVVMAVYNVRNYLGEAVQSLIDQTIGLERLQIILVDDGSSDGSGELCDAWKERYPDRIEVIHQENRGVSAARNAGMALARGKYINFMDADDRMDRQTAERAVRFLENEGAEADVASVPVFYFEGKEGEHWLNGKYRRGTRVIDLTEEYQVQQLMMNSAFFRRKAVEGICLEERMSISEDARFVSEVLMKKQKLGVVAEGRYLYRSRRTHDSALNTQTRKPAWYVPALRYGALYLLKEAREKRNEIPRWLQYTVFCDLKWRVVLDYEKEMQETISGEEQEEYRSLIREIMGYIADQVIGETPEEVLEWPWKRWLIQQKYPGAAVSWKEADRRLFYQAAGIRVTELTARPVWIRTEQGDGKRVRVRGRLCLPPELSQDDFRITLRSDSGMSQPCAARLPEGACVRRFGEATECAWTFQGSVPAPAEREEIWHVEMGIPAQGQASVRFGCLQWAEGEAGSGASEAGRKRKWKAILTPDAIHLLPLPGMITRMISKGRKIVRRKEHQGENL